MTYNEAWGENFTRHPVDGYLEIPVPDDVELEDVVTAFLKFRGPKNFIFTPPTRRERIRRRIRRIRNTPRRYHERLTIAAHALRGDLDGWTPDE
ncbi:hypothetical protein [Rhodococcoides fascians]|uniref:hypothetical protein n=1 Tax=Rhodococcoides fascians TaxID=1828 RepID=UPI00055CDDDE|nr:hypothetical protein [Rhodococcus fascians]